MKVVSKLSVAGKTFLTLDGDVLNLNASKVLVGGKEYSFDIAYDMSNTIGITSDDVTGDTIEFV